MTPESEKFKKTSVTAGDKVQELRDVLKGKKETGEHGSEMSSEAEPGATPELPEANRALLDEEIHVLEAKLKTAEEIVTEEKNRYLRLLAEFDNFKKRMQREKEESAKFANEKILQEIFPVLDHLEMTVEHAMKANEEEEKGAGGQARAILEGVELVIKQLEKSLEKFGLKKIGGPGEPFNPHQHEAIGAVETPEQKPGTIVAVHRYGFLLHDRLVRPALVTIAQEPRISDPSSEEERTEKADKNTLH